MRRHTRAKACVQSTESSVKGLQHKVKEDFRGPAWAGQQARSRQEAVLEGSPLPVEGSILEEDKVETIKQS